MNVLKHQTKRISELLPKIARNLRIAPLIEKVKPGLTTSQLMVLLILKETEKAFLPIGKLAKKLAVSFPTVSGIVDRLYKGKLVKRKRDSEDRRLVLVQLTNKGKKTVDKLLKAFEEILFKVLKEIPEAERETIVKATERVSKFSNALSKNA